MPVRPLVVAAWRSLQIAWVGVRTTVPLFFDAYRRNRVTGSFILVDEATNNTVGAGIILGSSEVAW